MAGTNDQVLNVILNVVGHPKSSVAGLVHVGGLINRGSDSFHVLWVGEQLQVGDEVRLRLLETEVVDPPHTEERSKTQREKDDDVRTGLLSVRAMLPDELGESDLEFVVVFEQRIEEESWSVAMRVLSEVGQRNIVAPPYWKNLAEVASQLQRYDEASQYRRKGAELEVGGKEQVPEVRSGEVKGEDATQHGIDSETEVKPRMRAIEVWVNGEKKCVADNNGQVLSAIVDVMSDSNIHVGGLVRREGDSFHVCWLNEPLRVGDEVRISLLETENVDPPIHESRAKTQTEDDNEICVRLLDVRAMLPSELGEDDLATVEVFEQRMKEESWSAVLKVLAELGRRNAVHASYWKALAGVAAQLNRYDEAGQYRAKGIELEGKQG